MATYGYPGEMESENDDKNYLSSSRDLESSTEDDKELTESVKFENKFASDLEVIYQRDTKDIPRGEQVHVSESQATCQIRPSTSSRHNTVHGMGMELPPQHHVLGELQEKEGIAKDSSTSPALLSEEENYELAAAMAQTAEIVLRKSGHGKNIVINNPQLYLTKKTELSAPRARNVNLGGTQNIHSLSQDAVEAEMEIDQQMLTKSPKNSRLKGIKDRTENDIRSWTHGMIKTSLVDEICKKIDSGVKWITITGNAGDGKTTTGYMVLEEMVKRGKEVFHVKETDQYHIVIENTKNCVIMLNDVLGAFAFDHTDLSKWESVMHDALDTIAKSKESDNSSSVTVIFISRWNVLQGGKNILGKYEFDILNKSHLYNLGDTRETVEDERLRILEYHLERVDVTDITVNEKKYVASGITPHGFPHCCKMYADLRKTSNEINITAFFSHPLQFLDGTTKVLTERYKNEKLFKLLIERDGKLDVNSIEDEDLRRQISLSVSSLIGSYLTDNNGIVTFSHPSIYESVACCIGRSDVVFAITKFSFSFVMQKLKFFHSATKETGEFSSDSVFIQPTESNIDRLCERFHLPILYRNYAVLHHPFFSEKRFCEKFISSVTVHRRRHFCCCLLSQAEPDKIKIDQRDEKGNTLLLVTLLCEYLIAARILIKNGADVNKATQVGSTPLHFLCKNEEVNEGTIELMIKHGADVNKADEDGSTPLHYLCKNEEVGEGTLELMIKHGADVNKADWLKSTPLHYLCKNEKVDGGTIELMIKHGADVNKAGLSESTPLHYLCKNEKIDGGTIELMIKHGADVNKADEDGSTPLHYLCKNEEVGEGTLELMIKHGADVNKADRLKSTPLHYLCKNEKVDGGTIELMIKHEADVNKADQCESTPVHYLCNNEKVDGDTIELMIKHGADVNKAGRSESTSLHYLCKNEKIDGGTMIEETPKS